MGTKRNPKDYILWKMHNVLRGQAMFIREDTISTPEEKLAEMKVVEQLVHFLDNYDENIAVLEQYHRNKAHTTEQMEQIEKEDMGYIDR